MQNAGNNLGFFFDDELEEAPSPESFWMPEEGDLAAKPAKKNYITTFDPKEIYTPAERIERLMAATKSTSKVLKSTLEFCREMQPIEAVNAHIDELQRSNASVYGPETLCRQLEDAGALLRVHEDGTPASAIANEPVVVVVDGVEYLEAPAAKPSFWLTTEDGAGYLDSCDPAGDLKALLDREPQYAHVYAAVLGACAADKGATAADLATLVNDDPAVQSPCRYSSYFVDQLQECFALEWRSKAWHATELGRAALA